MSSTADVYSSAPPKNPTHEVVQGRHKQWMSPTKNGEIVIETPVGHIIIQWTARPRKVIIELPGGLRAHKSMGRALEDGKYLRVRDGRVVPIFQVLVPKLDGNGEFAGVMELKTARITPKTEEGG